MPGFLRIFPRCFATGTAQRHYTTCTVDHRDYHDDTEPPDLEYIVNEFDADRAKGQSFEYLLKNLAPGEIFWVNRGKQMIIAAGHVGVSRSRLLMFPHFCDCSTS